VSATDIVAPFANSLDAALEYRRRGFSVLPIPRKTKSPRISNWPSLQISDSEVATLFGNGENIGIKLGNASGGLCDVDLDSPETVAVARFFLPPTEFVFGHRSNPRSHYFFVCEPHNSLSRPKSHKFSAPNGTGLVELRADGLQTVVPPSIHPSGESYEFTSYAQPAVVSGDVLWRAVSRIAAAALLAQAWPAIGRRNDTTLALAGMMLRGGWREEQVVHFVEAVVTAAGDDECLQRVRDVASTAMRLESGQTTTGTPTLRELIGAPVVDKVREWLGLNAHTTALGVTSWTEPAALGDELIPVPAFDFELLPETFRPLVEDISDRMQAPPDYAAVASIVALAGCVNRRAVIFPKQADTTWRVIPNLWGAIIAPPGMMKSPILHAVTLPLTRIEENWSAEFQSACDDFAVEKEKAELRFQAWREQYKQSVKKGESEPAKPDKSLPPPLHKRLILTDATFEKLHAILADNPQGVLVIRDELTGWLAELGRLGREGERSFFLQAWNGEGGFTVDRIGRGSIRVPNICVSLLGAIQPGRLRSYLSDAIEGGPGDDGLFQRFQLLVWPDAPCNWKLVDRPANETSLQTAEKVFFALTSLSAENPVQLRFAPDAQVLFFDWLTELETEIRRSVELAPPLVAHLAKYRSLMPSLAGLFELADCAANSECRDVDMSISLEHAKQAAALCDYLKAHAKRVYGCVISAEARSARELARHIHSGDLPSPFTTRSVYLKGWAGLGTPERVRSALGLLEEAGWVCRADIAPSVSGGRPSEVWIVNPRIRRADA
jgi:hypothetical protein